MVTDCVREIDDLYVVVGVNPPADPLTMSLFQSVHDVPFEGIAATVLEGAGVVPLVAANGAALERLRTLVQLMRRRPEYDGRELRIVRFRRVEVLEVIASTPAQEG